MADTKALDTPLAVKLYTPLGVVLDMSASAIKLPMEEGEVELLPGHINYVSNLKVGICEFTSSADSTKQRLVITGGFCRLTDEGLSIQADRAILPEEVDQAKLETNLKAANEILSEGKGESTAEVINARHDVAVLESLQKL